MDNAARALIMAATILVSVLLFSMMVTVFKAGSRMDQAYDFRIAGQQLRLFNSKFEVFDRYNNNIVDIISASNLAYNVNKDFDYDAARAIEVVIKIQNQYYVIPNVKPEYNGTGLKFERNRILSLGSGYTENINSAKVMSIYNLADQTLGDLNVSVTSTSMDLNDKLSVTKLGTVEVENAYGETLEKHNATIYKYLFECKCVCGNSEHSGLGLQYNLNLGAVNKIEFEMYLNPEWEK